MVVVSGIGSFWLESESLKRSGCAGDWQGVPDVLWGWGF